MLKPSNRLVYSAGVGVAAFVLSSISYWFYKYLKRDVVPQKWRRVGTLQQLNIFPMKSCAPLKLNSIDELDCDILGLRLDGFRDRGLMLIDDEYAVVTARAYPKMVLIQPKAVDATKLLFSAPQMEPLEVDFATLATEAPGKNVFTDLWGVKVDGILCNDKYNKWFSKCILNADKGLRLVYYPHPLPRRAVNMYMIKQLFITSSDTGAFGDGTSYMLMNQSSVDDLNTRLSNSVDTLQFRGNFHLLMDTPEPYVEDNWGLIRIGNDAIFRAVAPCMRCILPNINVYTGERDPDRQPLKTLNSYRKGENHLSGVLGVHLGLRQPGKVKLNDVIYVEDST